MDFLGGYWPVIVLLGGVLILAFRENIVRRVKKDIGPNPCEDFVPAEVCEEKHTGAEALSREIKEMVKGSLNSGDRRMDRIEKSVNRAAEKMASRIDAYINQTSGRFDTFELVANKRYIDFKDHVDQELAEFGLKLDSIIEENNKNEGH